MPPVSEPFVFAAIIAVFGALAGFTAGLFGIGGGLIVVPTLVTLFTLCGVAPDLGMPAAAGISLMVIVPTACSSLRTHARHGAIDRDILKEWAVPVVIGSVIGSFTAMSLSGAALRVIFGIFMALMALFIGLVPPNLHALPTAPPRRVRQMVAALIGFVSALVGIAGGTMTVPALTLFRTPIHRAVGTSSVMGLLVALPAASIFLVRQLLKNTAPAESLHLATPFLTLELIAFAVLVPATMLTAPYGARLAHKLSPAKLKRIFAFLLAVIAIKMLVGGSG